MTSTTVWLVDSNIYVYDAWHYCKTKAKDDQGRSIRGVIGFLHFVYELLLKERPAVIAFAFDEKIKRSHRKALYPDYKAHRKPLSPELALQFEYCRAFLDSLGLYQSSSHHYEADDLIGTWAKDLRAQGHYLNLITADKDLLQLIETGDYWWSYSQHYKHNSKSFHKRFKIYPHQVADQLALAGDKSDNIPGVKGIGMSTAAKLLRKFGDIETLLARIEEVQHLPIRYAKQIQAQLIQDQAMLLIAQQITTIKCDIDATKTTKILQSSPISKPKFKTLCTQLQLTQEQQTQWLSLIATRYPLK